MKEKIVLALVDAVKEVAGEGYEVWSQLVQKNNDVQLQEIICKRSGHAVIPNVYVDQLVSEITDGYLTVTQAAEKVFEACKLHENQEIEEYAEKMLDKDFILSHVEYQVINRERNQERIKEVPHKEVLDLVALYRVTIDIGANGIISYVIDNKMLASAGISMEELDQAAAHNTEEVGFEIDKTREKLEKITGMPEEIEDDEDQLFVVTNSRMINGANVLLYANVIGELADRVKDDLFILPSSINEVMAIPASQKSPEELSSIIREVNSFVVADEEILGYRVYRYSRETGGLSIE